MANEIEVAVESALASAIESAWDGDAPRARPLAPIRPAAPRPPLGAAARACSALLLRSLRAFGPSAVRGATKVRETRRPDSHE